MTASPAVQAKARRYLGDGRLVVVHVDADTIEATCRGAELYRLRGGRDQWECSCPARTRWCAHLVALRLVTTVDREHLTSADARNGRTRRKRAEAGQTHPLSPALMTPGSDSQSEGSTS